jgi:hypothetical protein
LRLLTRASAFKYAPKMTAAKRDRNAQHLCCDFRRRIAFSNIKHDRQT